MESIWNKAQSAVECQNNENHAAITIIYFLFCIKLWLVVEITEPNLQHWRLPQLSVSYVYRLHAFCYNASVTEERIQFSYRVHKTSLIFITSAHRS